MLISPAEIKARLQLVSVVFPRSSSQELWQSKRRERNLLVLLSEILGPTIFFDEMCFLLPHSCIVCSTFQRLYTTFVTLGIASRTRKHNINKNTHVVIAFVFGTNVSIFFVQNWKSVFLYPGLWIFLIDRGVSVPSPTKQ